MLFDTNVVLDVLLDRRPFSITGAQLFSHIEEGRVRGYRCATTVTTVYYLAQRAVGAERARSHVRNLLKLFEVAPVNRAVLEAALASQLHDFEDAVVHEAARHLGAQGIVTRNPLDFKHASLPVYAPEELWGMFRAREP